MSTMNAVTRKRFGSPKNIRIIDVEIPDPDPDEVLIKVYAASVTRGDAIMLKVPSIFMYLLRLIMGYRKKSIFGTEYAGEIVKVGDKVTNFEVGDHLYGTTTFEKYGSQAEYVCVKSDGIIARKPTNVSFAEAATLPVGAMTALYLLLKNNIEEAQKVIIYGASGSVGTFAVQIAKYFNAEVTGVASTHNQELVKSLGADLVLDYTADEFNNHTQTYDIVFDTVGKLSKKDRARFMTKTSKLITNMSSTKEERSLLEQINKMVEEGKLRSIIDQEYSIDQIIEAYEYVNTGRKRGNVAILISK